MHRLARLLPVPVVEGCPGVAETTLPSLAFSFRVEMRIIIVISVECDGSLEPNPQNLDKPLGRGSQLADKKTLADPGFLSLLARFKVFEANCEAHVVQQYSANASQTSQSSLHPNAIRLTQNRISCSTLFGESSGFGVVAAVMTLHFKQHTSTPK